MKRLTIKKNSFILIELLLVISIIIALLGLFFAIGYKILHYSRKITCANNIKQIYNATQMYLNDYDNYPPPWILNSPKCQIWFCVLIPYINDTKIFICPNDPYEGKCYSSADPRCSVVFSPNNPYSKDHPGCSYGYYSIWGLWFYKINNLKSPYPDLDTKIAEYEELPPKTIMFFCAFCPQVCAGDGSIHNRSIITLTENMKEGQLLTVDGPINLD